MENTKIYLENLTKQKKIHIKNILILPLQTNQKHMQDNIIAFFIQMIYGHHGNANVCSNKQLYLFKGFANRVASSTVAWIVYVLSLQPCGGISQLKVQSLMQQ